MYFSDYIGQGRTDLLGNKIEKTPSTHPYSYDTFATYVSPYYDGEGKYISVYSDRILQWDYDLTRKLMKKHFDNDGDYYNSRDPEDIEAFLRERFNKPKLSLMVIQEGCNIGNGFPFWIFTYEDLEEV